MLAVLGELLALECPAAFPQPATAYDFSKLQREKLGRGVVAFRSGGVNSEGGMELLQALTSVDDVVLFVLQRRAKAPDNEGKGLFPGVKDKTGA